MKFKFIFSASFLCLGLIQVFVYGHDDANTHLADPSALNCLNLGGKLTPTKTSTGDESMLCELNGREIDTWALLRETHPRLGDELRLMPGSK